MRFTANVFVTAILGASLVSGFCHNSISCLTGGDTVCNKVCVRQGNDSGGRCVSHDGCPGYSLCECYSQSKRSDEVINGDAALNDFLDTLSPEEKDEKVGKLVARDPGDVEKRSTCCIFPDPYGGLCCEDHCDYIKKPGGECTADHVCTCN